MNTRINHSKSGHFPWNWLVPAFLAVNCMMMPATAQPLAGNYSIDATQATGGTNFHSFGDFASALNINGISATVTATVVPGSGPYTEQVVINTIQGSGPNAWVNLEGNGEILTAVTNTTDRHVLRLANVQYFTVNNLHIVRDTTSPAGFYGIHIYGSGNFINITNCEVDMSGTTSTLYGGIVASGSLTSILVTGDFHNLNITGNTTWGGGYGASVFGLINPLASNIVISNNQFTNFHSNGVYLRETDGAIVSGNYFDKTTSNVTSCNAIQLAQAANINAQVFNNFIQITQTQNGSMTIRGIYLFNGTGHKVYNNVIHNINLQAGNFTAIEVRTGATAPQICFNTISIDNPNPCTGNFYGIKEELSNTNAVLRNNMLSMTATTSGFKSALVLGSSATVTTAFNSDYNDIWIPGGNVAQKGGGLTTPVLYTDLATWQSVSSQDIHTVTIDPVFVSPLYPQPANTFLDNLGIAIPWVPLDVTGITRGDPPDMGAYELSSTPPPTPDTIYGVTEACEFSVQNFTVSTVPGASSYVWTVTGASLVSGQGSASIVVAFSNTAAQISVYASNAMGNSGTLSLAVGILPLPAVTLNLPPDTLCLNWPPLTLTGGNPPGGTYTGPGVSNGQFDPAGAGTGTHTITYTFTATNGCSASDTTFFNVAVCTGITDTKPETHVRAVPNPLSLQSMLHAPAGSHITGLSLFDARGQLLKTLSMKSDLIPLAGIVTEPGLYILRVITDKPSAETLKLVVAE
ncbi:MAG TPA: hypothetical protein P5531_03135 [Bacteroidales bacterium]|nr:hypothetical protein [Bacteroidales bacterium]